MASSSSSSLPSSSTPKTTAAIAEAPDEQRRRDEPAPQGKGIAYKTKTIKFLGRTTPIVLQNDNGPCPLLAICNVLLLKNWLKLSPDVPEVLQEKLLSLVAERLLDSNSNVNDKDAGYVENRQQNIADAIDLLPRLTTGIDVNIKFERIGDFEFTRECAIFDLLDIPLYHGWIVDPQDHDTAKAIGSKSYNTLMGELVALETQDMGSEHKKSAEDDGVDFAAAATAALGVPSPTLSRGKSFNDSSVSISDKHQARKGDLEEEEELQRALKLSVAEVPNSSVDLLTNVHNSSNSVANIKDHEPLVSDKASEINVAKDTSQPEAAISNVVTESDGCRKLDDVILNPNSCESEPGVAASSSPRIGQDESKDTGEPNLQVEKGLPTEQSEEVPLSAGGSHVHIVGGNVDIKDQSTFIADEHMAETNQNGCDALDSSSSLALHVDSDLSSGRKQDMDDPETFTSSVDGSEPIYEGEECILESGTTTNQNQEPMYEGEVVLAKQVDGDSKLVHNENPKDGISAREGELIRNFLKASASQLTIHGLFCLEDGLKERELCVFFRNNHFNTMFKFDGELYILATDLGYLNQPDLVWEKLNEVNGDTHYVTSDFKEFKLDNSSNNTWDEHTAMASAAEYLVTVGNAVQGRSTFNADLQLAISLQQQEFEQQALVNRNKAPQPSGDGGSKLIIGPQVSRYSGKQTSSSSKNESKPAKEKCSVM